MVSRPGTSLESSAPRFLSNAPGDSPWGRAATSIMPKVMFPIVQHVENRVMFCFLSFTNNGITTSENHVVVLSPGTYLERSCGPVRSISNMM